MILGISAYYHDSAACLVDKGKIIAAAQEERFTRKKHDHRFPAKAIEYCLSQAGITAQDLDLIAFYDKPFVKFERLLETYLAYAPKGIGSFLKAMPLWIKQKLWIPDLIKKQLGYEGKIVFTEHHQSHAAAAFFPSPYDEAAILTFDGVGEWATTSYGVGKGNNLDILGELRFPHSLGLLYSAFTYYTGFRVNSGEYKVMGLAPYGRPIYKDLILKELLDLKEDGSFKMNMKYFNYCAGLTMTSKAFHDLFDGPPRTPETPLTQKQMDLAASVQKVTEEIMLRSVRHLHKVSGQKHLVLAGGVALNCVGNGRILREGPFEDVWVQPAAGDAGGALGAALFAWHQYLGNERKAQGEKDSQTGSYLGPCYENGQIKDFLESRDLPHRHFEPDELITKAAQLIAQENVLGWFQGRMEFGPRALGNRSIIGDARSERMQSVINLKIKYRESFRPFAPSVLVEDVEKYFKLDRGSPYMLMVSNVQDDIKRPMNKEQEELFGIEKLNIPRSDIPAVTHVDYSARIQTVHQDTNPKYHKLISAFKEMTGCSVIVNTSFNVRGEPIVRTPLEAYTCFMRTEMDYLVLGDYILDKKQQPPLDDSIDWQKEFDLD